MLLVNKNSNNTLILTLTEKATLTSPYYLFDFKSDITGNSVRFISSDLSTEQQRYNQFLITETSGTNILTSGTITLTPTGTWTYKVYEQSSSSNLNPILATTLLEIGIVKVVGTTVTNTPYSGQDNTIKVYGTGT